MLAAGVLVVGAGAVMVAMAWWPQEPSSGPLDMNGDRIVVQGPTNDGAIDDTGERFVILSVGLDVPLGELAVDNGVINPPGLQSAYWISNLGTSPRTPDQGTVFVAMHSVSGGVGPGNYVIDAAANRAKVRPGDDVSAGEATYTIDSVSTVAKSELQGATEIWADDPDRLVVITCMLQADGRPSVDNLIIVASSRRD